MVFRLGFDTAYPGEYMEKEMSLPKEIWVTSDPVTGRKKIYEDRETVEKLFPSFKVTHYREVREIDWRKLWVENEKWYELHFDDPEWEEVKKNIQELVEKSLKGDE